MTDEQRQRIWEIENSCDGRTELAERIVGLEDKSAKLREELAQWERLTAGIELPEYPISQFQPKDLERENAKLRELVRELWEGYQDPPCEDCPYKDTPACADCSICAREATVIDRMRKLGVEVD